MINTVRFYRQGISSVIMNYYRLLNHDKYHIDFVVNEYIDPLFRKEIEANGGEIFELKRNRTFEYFRKLLAIIKEKKYDIVHVHGNSATMAVELLAARIAGCSRRIAHSHNTTCMHMRVHRMLKPVFDMMYTEQLACSDEAGNWLFPGKKFTVINNSLNPDDYRYDMVKRSLIRHKLKIDEWELLIGHAGTIEYQKNQEYAIRLLHRVKERTEKSTDLKCKLIFLGKGSEENVSMLKELAESLGVSDNVIFYGETDDMQGFLSAMDIFVLPSRFEGLPLSLLEAEYAGLPCVVSDNVTEEAKISDLTYFLPLEETMDLWSDKLIELSEIVLRGTTKISRSKRKMLIRELADKFDIANTVSKLEEVYDEKPEALKDVLCGKKA